MRFLVLGGGTQGSACAFDLVQREGVDLVRVADLAVDRPAPFLEPFAGSKLELMRVDASAEREVRRAMEGIDAVACALPYYFNLPVTRLAIEARVHLCDLGGNTGIVRDQIAMHDDARAAGISIVPDCGLAPGMVNILAQGGIDELDATESVRVFVGGLPMHPRPPLNYRLAYSLEGVLDYYTTPVLKLEDGRLVEREALGEVEAVDFPPPLGRLEAFLTAGGISTMPYRYEGRVASMSYKTLRYPGHADIMRAIRELGLLDVEPIEVEGCEVTPRQVFIRMVAPRLTDPDGEDLVALRVIVSGVKGFGPHTIQYDLVDFHDGANGISAMMRTTGYSLAAVARLQAAGRIEPGVRASWECVPAARYVEELSERGVRIERSER